MSKEERHRKKKHHKNKTDENEEKNERSKDRLFTEADAQAAEMYNYQGYYPVSQMNPAGQERQIPLGVVEVDKSVKFPSATRKSPQNALQSSENHSKEDIHLPSITHHQPYEYYDPSNPAHHFGHFSHPYPMYHQYRVPNHHNHHHNHHHHHHGHHRHHDHHRHHHPHRHRHHHRHETEVETYDPRWWYMPIGSVHRPSSKNPIEYHYTAPKWYESPTAQSRLSLISSETKTHIHKYVDCRCEVCRPSKETPHGTRWVAHG